MSRRGLWISLIVSLALNLFLLGGLAGVALIGSPFHRPPQPGPPRLAALGAGLTPQQREAWQSTIRQTAQNSGPKLREARELRRAAWRNLTADKVDPEATIAALNKSRGLEFDARSEMDRAVVGFAATLPAEERRRLAEALSHGPRGGPHGRWSGRGPGPGGEPPLPDR